MQPDILLRAPDKWVQNWVERLRELAASSYTQLTGLSYDDRKLGWCTIYSRAFDSSNVRVVAEANILVVVGQVYTSQPPENREARGSTAASKDVRI